MRRVAVLYDIHGNLPGLEAVLREVGGLGVDLIIFGGDVAAGPMPVETIELVAATPQARFVRGNADRIMVEIHDGAREPEGEDAWPASKLNQAQRDFLAGFEAHVVVQIEGLGRVLCCHAGPESDELPIITPATPDAVMAQALAGTEADLVVCGHTHMQFDRRVGRQRMVNAGSVGMPYADASGAYWALLGPDVDLRRTEYDVRSAAAAVLKTGFPQRFDLAQGIVQPSTAAEAIAAFELAAGRQSTR